MKIAITGTGGIGKTTLANALATRFNIPLITEDMQPIIAAMNVLNQTKLNNIDTKDAQRAYH